MAGEPSEDARLKPVREHEPDTLESLNPATNETRPLFREAGLPVEVAALEGSYDPVFLRWAARRADQLGIGGDEVLRARSSFDSDHYLQGLAARLQLAVDWLDDNEPAEGTATEILATGVVRRRNENGTAILTVAPRGTAIRAVHDALRTNPGLHEFIRISSPERLRRYVERTRADELAHDAAFRLRDAAPRFSAALPSPTALRVAGISCVAASAAAIFAAPAYALIAIESLLAVAFSLFIALKLFACFGSNAPRPRPGSHRLPTYSVLVPLYKEANMVPALLANLAALDYPHEKLDIKLVVEPNDTETRAALETVRHDSRFEVFVVPDAGPRTKPKALSAALPFARGELVVVYDAEDEPAPDQLRVAAAAFATAGPGLACVQASLAVRNAGDNWLTKHFAAEYAGLFDVFLPALAGKRLPLPLGGTSNHFRAATLRKVGGWDPHNVTEDADLGMRLARFGFRTGVIDSTTMEEAPADFRNWLNQRTRWFKGWMRSLSTKNTVYNQYLTIFMACCRNVVATTFL